MEKHLPEKLGLKEEERKKLARLDFTIVSSNCLGGKIYQLLEIPYNTPFVGLYFFAPCYIQLLQDFSGSLKKEIRFSRKSKYLIANANRILNEKFYPIGLLDDIEIHFQHYMTEGQCVEKWTERTKKMNWDNLFFLFTDRDLCTEELIKTFDNLPFTKKVCFTAKDYTHYKSCVHIKEYQEKSYVGDLYNNFSVLGKYFDFASWLSGGSGIKGSL
jgi:uncharacterized protein (DUF1919 family)